MPDDSAVLSPCAKYRYRLDRRVGFSGPVYAFFGINPSTADAALDDATVRKWRGFCRRLGASRFVVGNVFAWRATDVRGLRNAPCPVGPDWHRHTEQIVAEADILVPCWGSSAKVPPHLRHRIAGLSAFLLGSGKPVVCWGKTASGDPKHPLMLAYDTPLEKFT